MSDVDEQRIAKVEENVAALQAQLDTYKNMVKNLLSFMYTPTRRPLVATQLPGPQLSDHNQSGSGSQTSWELAPPNWETGDAAARPAAMSLPPERSERMTTTIVRPRTWDEFPTYLA